MPDITPVVKAPAPAVTAEAPATPDRTRSAKRRSRLARSRTRVDVATLKPGLADGPAGTAVALQSPAPAEVSAKASEINTETASATPGPPAVATPGGPREQASGTVSELLARHALANGVPLKLAEAVVRIESRGNAHASNAGALGLMQIKYGTARAAGFGGPAVGLFVADTNLRYGMKILGEAYKAAGGDTCGALMRYQSGHLATHMSRANQAYCSRARAIMAGA